MGLNATASITLVLIMFAIVLIGAQEKPAAIAAPSLRMVHMLFRHGDRTPVRPYPKDPYVDVKNWPVSWGQLTNDGKLRQYRLGQFNRQRYVNFLSDDYSPEEVYIRSTDVDRTLMSAEAHLAGLYPPSPNQTWNPDLIWQPIPIHTVAKDEDLLLMIESNCTRYDELLNELNESPEVRKRLDEQKEMLNYLAEHSGLPMTIIDDVEYLYDTLFIEDRFNKTLPKWTRKVFPGPMKELSDFSFVMKAYTPEMQRLRGGPWVKEVADNMRNYSKVTLNGANPGAWKRKLFMYSGHDVSVATVLSALKVFNGVQPPYASMVLVELHELNPGSHYVQVLYKNVSDDGEDPFPLTLPGCKEFCPIEEFYRLIADVTVDDLKVECKLTPPPAKYDPFLVICALGALSGILFLALLVICAIWYRREKTSGGYTYSAIQAE